MRSDRGRDVRISVAAIRSVEDEARKYVPDLEG